MTPERWQRINELFHAALVRQGEGRRGFLDEACAGDVALRSEVERLVQAEETARAIGWTGAFEGLARSLLHDEERTTLAAGDRLGPYEILAPLGRGGMGQVYRARDTRVERDVAVKVLPPASVSDPERRLRFEQEARSIAALVHPHICTLFEFDRERPHRGGTEAFPADRAIEFLVMELVDGESLAARLQRGPLPVDEAIQRSIDIADALAHAHRRGVVHRDLKPANVMLTKGGAKLLDFGLAKTTPPLGMTRRDGGSSPQPAADALTAPGLVLGTLPYMAPEGVNGRAADARTDIWAFGCLLHEMLTGTRLFAAESPAELIGAILRDHVEPVTTVAGSGTRTHALAHVIRKCLAKDPEDRWQDMRDVRDLLGWIKDQGIATDGPARSAAGLARSRAVRGTLIAAALAVVAGVLAALLPRSTPETPRPIVYTIAVPEPIRATVTDAAPFPAISPDGSRVVYATGGGPGVPRRLWLQQLDALEPRMLLEVPPGEWSGQPWPFWSPDSRRIGFFAQEKLKWLDVGTGATITICDAPNPAGGAWSPDGTVVFAGWIATGGLYRVSEGGGSPVQITRREQTPGADYHRFPVFLPDGVHFLFATAPDRAVWVGSLDGTAPKRLSSDVDSRAIYASGHLLFVRDTTLVAQPFDPRRLSFTGPHVALAGAVRSDLETLASTFAVSENGTLVYRPGEGTLLRQLAWFDRKTRQMSRVPGPLDAYQSLDLMPDERRAVAHAHHPDGTGGMSGGLWLVDLERGTRMKMTGHRHAFEPTLSPDGEWMAFGSNDGGRERLYRRRVNGSGDGELVLQLDARVGPSHWSRNWIVANVERSRSSGHIWTIPLAAGMQPTAYLEQPHRQAQGRLSPDERWMAYLSDEMGDRGVYVSSFPDADMFKAAISSGSGVRPWWRADGQELFYLAAGGRLMATSVSVGAKGLEVRQTEELIAIRGLSAYAPTRDGGRLLLIIRPDGEQDDLTPRLVVTHNWRALGGRDR